MWPFMKKPAQAKEETAQPRGSVFTTDLGFTPKRTRVFDLIPEQPTGTFAMDSSLKEVARGVTMPDAQLGWYGSQGFIGYQACALLAQHWLIDKACSMPARDAVRMGYEVNSDSAQAIAYLKKADKAYGITKTMREFVHLGRVFGVRVAIFKVDSTDPEFYQKPFNIDGVQRGSYRGISQVDPTWCIPELDTAALADPASLHFYEPLFYQIGGVRYHRSHLAIYIPHPVADLLKPAYFYGGVSVPQRIYERVYAAERTANEAPQLAMTKRLNVLKGNAADIASNPEAFELAMQQWITWRDNYGVKVIDKEAEDIMQFDTGLADLDATIMTQYQLCAAIANVPATKLLGTTPKGFNSTGEYEEATYREDLESIQANDLQPLLERHHQIALKSAGIAATTEIDWRPLDSPTAAEWADINLKKAQAFVALQGTGAIDGYDIRRQLQADKASDFYGLEDDDEAEQETL